MTNKELKDKANNYTANNGIDKNTYAIQKAYIDGVKMALEQGESLPIDSVKGWVSFDDNRSLFTKYALKNCRCLFDDGSVCNYNDEHPFAILTHFEPCP